MSVLYIFIDGSYLFKRSNDLGLHHKVNKLIEGLFQTLQNNFQLNCILGKVYYYYSIPRKDREPEAYKNKKRFLKAITAENPLIEPVEFRLHYSGGEAKEKGLETTLAMEFESKANLYDIGIVLSGDGDFAPPIKKIQDSLGKTFYVAAFPGSLSLDLRLIVRNRIIWLSDAMNGIYKKQ